MLKKHLITSLLLTTFSFEIAHSSRSRAHVDEDVPLSRVSRLVSGGVLMASGGGMVLLSFLTEQETNRFTPMIPGWLEIDNSWSPVIVGSTIFSFGILMLRSAFSDNS